MSGALSLTRPEHLLKKLEFELERVRSNQNDSYTTINALRDAYLLREWVWHACLEHDSPLQIEIIGSDGKEADWNNWVNVRFPNFPVIRDLCNGSKHFKDGNTVKATLGAGWGSPLFAYASGPLGCGVGGFFIQVENGDLIEIRGLLIGVHEFWNTLFKQYPQLS